MLLALKGAKIWGLAMCPTKIANELLAGGCSVNGFNVIFSTNSEVKVPIHLAAFCQTGYLNSQVETTLSPSFADVKRLLAELSLFLLVNRLPFAAFIQSPFLHTNLKVESDL